jgi:hypothetical protein
VYIEAPADDTDGTANDTSLRLLRFLREELPGVPPDLDLPQLVAWWLTNGYKEQKLLVVLDQFEQWLHTHPDEESGPLLESLRQCDGRRLQCMLLVRSDEADFFDAATQFIRRLGVTALDWRKNAARVDLFAPDHARKVLEDFGRAYGRLAEPMSQDQKTFVEQSVADLTENRKVTPVRLAMFFEMVKDLEWTPRTLEDADGAKGAGVAFLKERFGRPEHRRLEPPARRVLRRLLPEEGLQIKGHSVSRGVLEEVSELTRPGDFDDLMRLLERELRLITTAPSETRVAATAGPDPESPERRYYQLTHDYLVPSIRDWLTRKQRETRRGRAELRLAERAALWNARPENRHLPAWWEWLNIRAFTRKKDWTPPQRKMMRRAPRHA